MKILYEISKLDIPVAIFFPLKTSIVPKYLHKKKPNMEPEIAAILKKNNVKKEDIELARKKTTELQLLVQQLTSRNNTVEEEKQQISVALDNVNIQMKNMEGNVQQLTNENKVLAEKVTIASNLSSLNNVYGGMLSAMSNKGN